MVIDTSAADRRYGRGNHPARLNFGDCFAYALARVSDEPLLYKGDDFAKTDLVGVAGGPEFGETAPSRV